MKKLLCNISILISCAVCQSEDAIWQWEKYGLEKTNNPCAIPQAPQKGSDMGPLHKAWSKIDYSTWGADTIFLGDSITCLWNSHPTRPNGAKPLSELRKKYAFNPINFGIAGIESQDLLWLLTEGDIIKQGVNPKVAVLMIGINSLNRKKTPEQVADGIKTVIEVLKRMKPEMKILLLGIWPCWPKQHPVRTKVTEANHLLEALADWKNVYFLDLGNEFLTDKGEMNSILICDGIHLSEKGYVRWGELMMPYLTNLLRGQTPELWDQIRKNHGKITLNP